MYTHLYRQTLHIEHSSLLVLVITGMKLVSHPSSRILEEPQQTQKTVPKQSWASMQKLIEGQSLYFV